MKKVPVSFIFSQFLLKQKINSPTQDTCHACRLMEKGRQLSQIYLTRKPPKTYEYQYLMQSTEREKSFIKFPICTTLPVQC